MTYVSFIIRRNGTKIRRVAGVKTPEEALLKFATATRNNVDDLKAKGYTAEEIPADTPEEMAAKNDARHSKWFHGRSGASKVADRLVRQAERRRPTAEAMNPKDLVNSLLEDDKPVVLRNKKPEKKGKRVYIRVASPEGYEPEGDPSYYGPFGSVGEADAIIAKYPSFKRIDQGVYDYDDGQTQLSCNVMLGIPTGVKAKLPSSFDGDWAWTIQEDCGKPDCIPELEDKGITVTKLPGGPGFMEFKVDQNSAGGMEDDHWIANQISWHYGAENRFTVGSRKGNSFIVRIPSK